MQAVLCQNNPIKPDIGKLTDSKAPSVDFGAELWKYFVCLIAFFLISEEKTCHQSRRKVEKRLKFVLTFVIIVNMKYCITIKPYYLYYSGIYFGAMSFF